ncbi:MAG: FxsA family protein [Gammaproteobacteria bacterium]
MSPVGVLFLLFLLVPLVEIYFLIKVGNLIGAIPTIGLVVLTALLGAVLLRLQGWVTLQRTRMTLARGELPALEVLEGVLLLFSGALLLTPGFVTDAVGFAFLVPPLRRALVVRFIQRSNVHVQGFSHDSRDQGPRRHTIEGEYRRDDD